MSGEEWHAYQPDVHLPAVVHGGALADCPLPHPGYLSESGHRYRAAAWAEWIDHDGSRADCELPHPVACPAWSAEMDAAWLAGKPVLHVHATRGQG